MSSTTRSGGVRRAAPPRAKTPPPLSKLESLIFAQTVYEFGTRSWDTVSNSLSKHKLLLRERPKKFFGPSACQTMYRNLMTEAGLIINEGVHAPKSKVHLDLARKHFHARYQELRVDITEKEKQFQEIAREIDEIRKGDWDGKILAKLTGVPIQEPTPESEAEPQMHINVDEDLSKADLAEVVPETPVEPEPPVIPEPEIEPIIEIVDAPQVEEQEEAEQAVKSQPQINPLAQEEEEEEEEPESDLTKEPSSTESSSRREVTEAIPVPPLQELQEAPLPKQASTPAVVATTSAQDDAEQKMDVDSPRPTPAAATPVTAAETPAETNSPADVSKSPEPSVRRRGKRKHFEIDTPADSPQDYKRQRGDSEDEDDDQGPSNRGRRSKLSTDASQKRFQNLILILHTQISQHRNGNIFHQPIKPHDAPDYNKIVFRPMDLKTIKQRVRDGHITDSLKFQRDIYLMFCNALMYNRPGSDIYRMAEEMMLEAEVAIEEHKQTEGYHVHG